MTTTAEKFGDVVVMVVASEFSGDTVQQFRGQAEEQLAAGNTWYVLDFEKTTTMDSTGLEALLWFRDAVESVTGLVKACTLDESCAKIFEATRFDRKFEVFANVTDAVKSYE